MRPEEHRTRRGELAGWQVEIVSYRLGPRWYCQIDNVDPGARLTRRFADSREEAERLAIDRAREMLERTRTYEV